MKIALAQINPVVGDITGNSARIARGIDAARSEGANLVVFPELAVVGYPPKDLLLKPHFIQRNVAAVEQLAAHCRDIVAVFGFVRPNPQEAGKDLLNSAAICGDGRVLHVQDKVLLPTYDVFDESRYFAPAPYGEVVTLRLGGRDWRLGLSICEDLWSQECVNGHRLYRDEPVGHLVNAGAELLINISASPFCARKPEARREIFRKQIMRYRRPLVHVNQVGGNDDLIFDGGSACFSADATVIAQAKFFTEDLLIYDTDAPGAARCESIPDELGSVHAALVLGTRDYVRKCGFREVVLGLSGGIDSAVSAALAVEALGAEHVHGVAMPSRYSSEHSLADAEQLAHNLDMDYRVISIEECYRAAEQTLAPHFADLPLDVTEENLQARARGNILMALSNKFGWLLLSTGNKSELSVGYCTLYGDMSGGLAIISDVPKTMVYALARRINARAGQPMIPESTITKPPSAELRESQTDQDTLPPYEVLDGILAGYIEREMSADALVAAGYDRDTVRRVVRLVDCNEYKRKQAAIGLKVTSRAFGSGRRMPIAACYD
jgi:NAD+ synthetase